MRISTLPGIVGEGIPAFHLSTDIFALEEEFSVIDQQFSTQLHLMAGIIHFRINQVTIVDSTYSGRFIDKGILVIIIRQSTIGSAIDSGNTEMQ